MSGVLCRDCGWRADAEPQSQRCPDCRSPRLVAHRELFALGVAHIDCDAFYAAVEKRDDPALREKPLIIGGGRRGVVATACYIARLNGVRSAMPMFEAKRRCPSAVVLKPDMAKYVAASRAIRAKLDALTPLVEPLSLDEAFLDLRGAERLHGASSAETLAQLARDIEADVGVTISIGLAPNKFLAKIASELDKPRGFAVIGAAEAEAFLADKPVSWIFGVGPAAAEKLRADGYALIGDLRREDPATLFRRYGALGGRLARLSRAEDARPVRADRATKSVSSETTFGEDVADPDQLDGELWRQAVKVSDRLKAKRLAGRTVTLKLKTARFQTVTRRRSLSAPADLADLIYAAAAPLLSAACAETPSRAYRLLGVGVSGLAEAAGGDTPDFFDPEAGARAKAERAADALRARFGPEAVFKGRALR